MAKHPARLIEQLILLISLNTECALIYGSVLLQMVVMELYPSRIRRHLCQSYSPTVYSLERWILLDTRHQATNHYQ